MLQTALLVATLWLVSARASPEPAVVVTSEVYVSSQQVDPFDLWWVVFLTVGIFALVICLGVCTATETHTTKRRVVYEDYDY
jgi:hypothetical protein